MLSANQKIVLACVVSSAIAVSANFVPIIGHEGPTVHFTLREAAGLVVVVGLLFCGFNALLILALHALATKLRRPRHFTLMMAGLIILSIVLWGGSFQALAWGNPNAWALVTFALAGLLSLAFMRLLPTSKNYASAID